MENSQVKQEVDINRIAFRAPPFWDSDPEMWFQQVESQFIISGITVDQTKFHYVVASLDAKTLNCCRDLICSPPQHNAYNAIKEKILSSFSLSENSRFKQLLQDLILGDKRPSQLLSEMRHLANNAVSEDMLRTLWLQRLPTNMQQILSVCKDSLSNLAEIADKINEVSDCGAVASGIASSSLELGFLRKEISELKLEIGKLSFSRNRCCGRNRKRSKSRDRSTSFSTVHSGKLCWYHKKFAGKAVKCVKPCKWPENS